MSIEGDFASRDSPIKFIEEATTRFGSVILLILASSLLWIYQVDHVLAFFLNELVPCDDGCTNLYDPYSWTRLRWITAFILSFIPLIPYTFFQIFKFLEPGLFLREKKYLRRLFFFVSIGFLVSVYITMFKVLPSIYSLGHNTVETGGFQANYDAVSMLYLSVSFVWSLMLLMGYVSIALSAGGLNVINKNNVDSWRWATYSSLFFFVFLTTNFSDLGIQWIVLAIMILILESIISTYSTNYSTEIEGLKTILDSDFRERNIVLVDCSCDGLLENNSMKTVTPVGRISVDNLCENNHEREIILDSVNFSKVTDLIISGCSSEPLPSTFKRSCEMLSCKLDGLELLSINSMRTKSSSEIEELQTILTLSSFITKISENLRREIMQGLSENELHILPFNFGTCVKDNMYVINNPNDESLMHKV